VTTASTTAALSRPSMTSSRKTALAAGILYLLTFVSIPTLGLYAGVEDPHFIAGHGPDTPAIVGALLEIIVALACIGTAVAVFPVVKKQNESMALGFVGARILEAGAIFAGVVTVLALVTLRQSGVGPDGLLTARALVALHDWFRFGQGLMPAVNAVLLGTLLYRSRLVPRALPILAFIGAPLLLASDIAILFGVLGAQAPLAGLAALPIAVWEFSLGLWLTFKGFRPDAAEKLG
jgi:hypothetical protein